MKKKYPHWSDYHIEEIIYGFNPLCGIGIYTMDGQFAWPDRHSTTENEYKSWVEHLKTTGYRLPVRYRNAFYKEKSK